MWNVHVLQTNFLNNSLYRAIERSLREIIAMEIDNHNISEITNVKGRKIVDIEL